MMKIPCLSEKSTNTQHWLLVCGNIISIVVVVALNNLIYSYVCISDECHVMIREYDLSFSFFHDCNNCNCKLHPYNDEPEPQYSPPHA